MTGTTETVGVEAPPAAVSEPEVQKPRRRRIRRVGATVLAQGEPMLWLTGGGLVTCLVMIIGLLLLVLYQGVTTFWPVPVERFATVSGAVHMGEVTRTDIYDLQYSSLANMVEAQQVSAERLLNPVLREEVGRLIAADDFESELAIQIQQAEQNLFSQLELSASIRAASPEERAAFLSGIQARLENARSSLIGTFREDLAAQASADTSGDALSTRWKELRAQSEALILGNDLAAMQGLLEDGSEQLPVLYSDAMYSAVGSGVAVPMQRRLVRTGNYELTNEHFNWVSDFEISEDGESTPEWALLFERIEKGRFYGIPVAMEVDGEAVASESAEVWSQFQELYRECRDRYYEAESMALYIRGDLSHRQESARLALREVELDYSLDSPEYQAAKAEYDELAVGFDQEYAEVQTNIEDVRKLNSRYQLKVATADGVETNLALADIVRVYPANQVSDSEKLSIYLSRWYEFLMDNPREANNEGGVFPAIFGTVAMTILMAIAVVPFGVLAALYLREYAKSGPLVSMVRIAINNLAGVPSIVFGVFGLGFFCYIIGAYIDGGPKNAGFSPWPQTQWFAVLGLTVVCGTVGFFSSLSAMTGPAGGASPRKKMIARLGMLAWIAATVFAVILVVKTPHFEGFYRARLPSPTYGTGGLLWASLTLSLLTLPVVIVATEEALAAVPRSMREGSLACGATRWQTIRRIVLPRALPGIMTGMILAMARGAGEVAPLMLVGAMKLAPHLPIDIHDWSGSFGLVPTGPVHAERSFMHLGFHIYDLGFQSQNSEAAKPMVFTTTLLLIGLIALMNLVAIWMRARLRKKFQFNQF